VKITNDPEYLMAMKERERLLAEAAEIKVAMAEYEAEKVLIQRTEKGAAA
jgi:hypothetical protein